MTAVKWIAEGLFVVPLAILFLNNLLPKVTARRYFCVFAGAAAAVQGLGAVTELVLFYVYNLRRYEFSVFYGDTVTSDRFCIKISTLFLMACIGMVAFVSVMIARKTVSTYRRSYVNLLMCLILGMNGMLLVTDLFSLYVFLEIVGITSFVMIAMFRSRAGLEGSFKYLVVSAVGVMLLLVGLALLFMQTGSLAFEDISYHLLRNADASHRALTGFAVILMICGFAVKAGAVPFHSWLPDAHQSADTAVSVLLSGIVIKVAGIYGLIVIRNMFGSLPAVQLAYRVIGLLSVVVGALLAARQNHFKRICAYSSVSQMGYIILGLSVNTNLGIIGAVAHIFSHAVFKSTLFTNAAALHEQAGTLDVREMGGLEKQMPVTAFSSVIAFFSTAGIPPCCGFWSKLLIVLALWKGGAEIWGAAALIASILTGAYFLRLQKRVFFGKPTEKTVEVKEIGGTVRFIETALTAVTIGAGLLFPVALILLQNMGYIA